MATGHPFTSEIASTNGSRRYALGHWPTQGPPPCPGGSFGNVVRKPFLLNAATVLSLAATLLAAIAAAIEVQLLIGRCAVHGRCDESWMLLLIDHPY